ncbi:hypothetical protein [Aestuariirhabdus litorea]|uniref:Uncharacterized protein n=1 Tax=Aestuariirhabdus litorea TaxID=2528527 RepID=A0A3P3VRF1_9GAMM|nr:hypothetical protein [Aestuariirhabdus litorea]RRJ85210.1 hypothetical protein D0544_09125 [Aestuariirhabdus litorea]RWW98431.1 hypothetical protein DZC74_09110 [Endozoicomonadaceae bacterium GTF-13]
MKIQGWMGMAALLPALLSTTAASAEAESELTQPRWRQEQYRIVPRSVCYNYRRGSIEYRRCRVEAKQRFRQRCQEYGDKVENTQYPYNLDDQRKQRMYCTAARSFNPLSL